MSRGPYPSGRRDGLLGRLLLCDHTLSSSGISSRSLSLSASSLSAILASYCRRNIITVLWDGGRGAAADGGEAEVGPTSQSHKRHRGRRVPTAGPDVDEVRLRPLRFRRSRPSCVLRADPLCSKATTISKTRTPHQVDPPACNGWRRFILGVGSWHRQPQAMSRSENGRERWVVLIAIAIPPGR
jgi:hypothetical protein